MMEREGEGKTVNECFHCTNVREGEEDAVAGRLVTHIPIARVTSLENKTTAWHPF